MPGHSFSSDDGCARLRGRRVVVTGGTTGIGRATTALLAGEGAHLFIFGRHEQELQDALAVVGPGRVDGMTADASVPREVERVFDQVDARLGGIDALVACAALGADRLDAMADEEWRYVVETNLLGYMACTKAALMRMKAQGSGQIALVGSVSAELKAVGESVYAATKAGIQAFAETLRKEVAEENIRVSVIAPGATGSDMQPKTAEEQRTEIAAHRMLRADQVAEAILFVLTREDNCDVVSLRIEPRLQATG